MLLELSGLFVISFVAATIFPAQSEIALVGLQLAGYPIGMARCSGGNRQHARRGGQLGPWTGH